MQRVIAVVGATATGKTALGEALARELGGEIVCADSRQVFAELELGTGKPTPAERAALPHHLFDALHLGDAASAGWFARAARTICTDVLARGAVPIVVGGSGLYLRALMEGLHTELPRDRAVRDRWRERLREEGGRVLHAELATVDPASATRLAPADGQRIVRALEVFETSGRPLSWWHAQPRLGGLEASWQVLELTCEAATLEARIAARTHDMFEHGLTEETRALVDAGLEAALRALRAVGYDEALDLLAGRIDRPAAEARTTLRTRQLAKRQRTWFRHQVTATRIAADAMDPAGMLEAAVAAMARG